MSPRRLPGTAPGFAEDGTGWLTARFEAESVETAMMLVFGLGRDAEIVEPQELSDAVRLRCNSLLIDTMC